MNTGSVKKEAQQRSKCDLDYLSSVKHCPTQLTCIYKTKCHCRSRKRSQVNNGRRNYDFRSVYLIKYSIRSVKKLFSILRYRPLIIFNWRITPHNLPYIQWWDKPGLGPHWRYICHRMNRWHILVLGWKGSSFSKVWCHHRPVASLLYFR